MGTVDRESGPEHLISATEQFFDAYTAHDIDRMISLCAPGMTLNYVPEGENGKGGVEKARALWSMFTTLIPDFRVRIERLMAGGDFVVAETVQGGKPSADIGAIVAKGETTMARHCYVIVFATDGRIAEITCYWDYNQIYAQLRHTERHD